MTSDVGSDDEAQSLSVTVGSELDVGYEVTASNEQTNEVLLVVNGGRVLHLPGSNREADTKVAALLNDAAGTTQVLTYDDHSRLLVAEPAADEPFRLGWPLPVEPLGIGAHWKIDTAAVRNGNDVRIQIEFTLTHVDATAASADMKITVTYQRGTIEIAGLEEGAVEIESGETSGTGVMRWAAGEPIPLSEVTLEGDLLLSIERGVEVATLAMHQREELSTVTR